MPPKRKQTDDTSAEATSSTRSTRASARSGAKNSGEGVGSNKATGKGSAKATASTEDDAMDVGAAPAAKKARTTATATKKKAGGAKGKKAKGDDAPVESAPAPKPPQPAKKPGKAEPYTAQRALDLFSAYADADDTGVIGPEGFERLCTDADMPLDGSRPIIFAWQMGAKEMAKISKEEWVRGTSSLRVSSIHAISVVVSELEDLLVKGKPPVKPPTKKDEEYNRSVYMSYAADPKAAFRKLYQFSFALVKPEQSKNIDMDTSVAFWTVLLVPKFLLMGEVLEFISEKPGTYKATNKDLWSMMLEFCETVKSDLSNYEADGAWPTLLDDFVASKGVQADTGNGRADGDD